MSILKVNINRASHASADMILRRLFGMGGHERKGWYVVEMSTEQAEGFAGLMHLRGVPKKAVVVKEIPS
jgi:hypothetical protein